RAAPVPPQTGAALVRMIAVLAEVRTALDEVQAASAATDSTSAAPVSRFVVMCMFPKPVDKKVETGTRRKAGVNYWQPRLGRRSTRLGRRSDRATGTPRPPLSTIAQGFPDELAGRTPPARS